VKVHLIYNPEASDAEQITPQEILEPLVSLGYDPVYRPTEEEEHLNRVIDEIEGGLVVVAGGDGSVRAVVERVIGRELKMTVLPVGGANNIAKTFGIEGDPRELLSRLDDPLRRSFDIGRLQLPEGERVFLEGTGCGLFGNAFAAYHEEEAVPDEEEEGIVDAVGDLIKDVGKSDREREEEEEEKAFTDSIEAAIAVVDTQEPFHTRVTVDGEMFEGEFLAVEVMNTPVIGPNIELAPDADPGDGQLDVVFIDPDVRDELAGFLQSLVNGEVGEMPSVEAIQGEKVRLEWAGLPLHYDARVFAVEEGQETSVTCDLHPTSLEVWIPRLEEDE
jgi:diacylglycerol kinase family enzyme